MTPEKSGVFYFTRYLWVMELRSLIRRVLNEQVDQNLINLKNKYVGEGKPLSEDDFNKIIEVAGNKFYLISWLTKKVGSNIIKAEDIYKYKDYFDLYEKNKRKFKHKDIHLYKTEEDVKNFLKEIIKLREGDIVFDETRGKDNFVSQNDIEKLEASGGVKYLGIYDNGEFRYQVFQIFGISYDVWKLYRDILGRCKGRDKGAVIDICTIGNFHYFKQYLRDPKGSNYFVLYNLDDATSPYQLHYESGQFMDKNDSTEHGINQLKFFDFVGKKVPKYSLEKEDFPGSFMIPVVNKGFIDDEGKKQGLFKSMDRGKVSSIYTFKDDEEMGPYEIYFKDGSIQIKGNERDNVTVGNYEEYWSPGHLEKKGVFDENGEPIGIWEFHFYKNQGHKKIDFSTPPNPISGFTSGGKLRYISQIRNQNWHEPVGPITFFGKTGKIVAQGQLGVSGQPLGKWQYFSSDGKIKSQGRFIRGYRSGPWVDRVKAKDGNVYIFKANFGNGYPIDKISVFDENGEFLKKIKPKKIQPVYWTNNDLNLYKFTTQ